MKCSLLISVASVLLIFSCTKDKIEKKEAAPVPAPANYCDSLKSINVVSYSCFVDSVLKKNCALAGCHVSNTGLPDWTKYSDVKTHAGHIAERIQLAPSTPGFMPQGGTKLSDSTIEKIVSWINAGAPNN